MNFDRVQVFSATKALDRRQLGSDVTKWLAEYDGRVIDKVVTQSSDSEFHCLSITLFCQDNRRQRQNTAAV